MQILYEILNAFVLIGTAKVPLIFLTILLFYLLFWITVLRFQGVNVPSFYYVTLFGLLPYRLVRANPGVGDELDNISVWSVVLLVMFFFYIWQNIDKILYSLFNSTIGQFLTAYILFVADKLTYFDEKLSSLPFFRGFFYGVSTIFVFLFWIYLECPYAFFLLLVTPILWYKNFVKHFLKDEAAEIDENEFQEFQSHYPKDPKDFNWTFMVSLISYVMKRQKQYPVSNKLGSKLGDNLKYPNIFKRYLPSGPFSKSGIDMMKKITGSFGAAAGVLGAVSSVSASMGHKIENHDRQRKHYIATKKELNAEIQNAREESEKLRAQINELSTDYQKVKKHQLILEDKTFSFYKAQNLQQLKEIEEKIESQYATATQKLHNNILAESAAETVNKSNVSIIQPSLLERFITGSEEKASWVRKHEQITPADVINTVKSNPEVKKIFKNTYPTEDCPPVSEDQQKAAIKALEKAVKSAYDNTIQDDTELKGKVVKELRAPVTEENIRGFLEIVYKEPDDF